MGLDEIKIVKELGQLGLGNYVETTMSLRSIEIKKNIELMTREYLITDLIRRAYEVINSEIISYYIHQGSVTITSLITSINKTLQKLLCCKDFRVWVRDIMNNTIWSVSL